MLPSPHLQQRYRRSLSAGRSASSSQQLSSADAAATSAAADRRRSSSHSSRRQRLERRRAEGGQTILGQLAVRRNAGQPDATLTAAERRVIERRRNVGIGRHCSTDSLSRQVR